MQQGKKEISATHIEYADKAVITSNHYPLLLRCDNYLKYHIYCDGVRESAFEFHIWQGINIEPVQQVGYQ